MALFRSSREKRLWIYASLVLVAIFSTLWIGRPLLGIIGNQNMQGVVFGLAMFLVGAAILFYGLKFRPKKIELEIWLGLAAVYLLFVLRLSLPERSHLIEYSVLAVFIHAALIERTNQENYAFKPALYAFMITFAIGALDEWIQKFIPDRMFDTNDILFNGLAILMAIGTSMMLIWIRKKLRD